LHDLHLIYTFFLFLINYNIQSLLKIKMLLSATPYNLHTLSIHAGVTRP